MTRSVFVSSDARSDLLSIAEWIALENPRAALRTINRIISAIDGLADYAIGRPGRISGTHERVIVGIPYIVI